MSIPSINIPSINIPGRKLFSGFQFTTRTWMIIIFVLGMFLLSCMSNRCTPSETFEDPINRFEHTHFDGPRTSANEWLGSDGVCHYDSADPLDLQPNPPYQGIVERFDDDGRNFAPKPWYSCRMKTNCLPGESDTGEFCVKEGCPAGMERGSGNGSEFCYPKCAPGYESDGGGRCYKICPEGYLTQGDNCIRPKHTFKKDVIPCKGCNPPPPTIPKPQIPIVVEEGPGPVWMNTPFGYGGTSIETSMVGPVMYEGFDDNKLDSTSDRQTVPDCKGKECMKPKGGVVWRVEDRIHVNELPCPLGYTLSGSGTGGMCYENCPPNYRDTGAECVLDRYSTPRPSYDRGSGIPYATKRSKYHNIDPVRQCE